MSSLPVYKWRCGKIELALWQGDYQGKATYSYSITKNYYSEKDKEWKSSDYFTFPDLRDIFAVVMRAIMSAIKGEKVEAKPKEPEPPPIGARPTQEEQKNPDIPF